MTDSPKSPTRCPLCGSVIRLIYVAGMTSARYWAHGNTTMSHENVCTFKLNERIEALESKPNSIWPGAMP